MFQRCIRRGTGGSFHRFPETDKGCTMRALKFTGVSILLLSFYTFAGLKDTTKSTFHSFTGGLALPLSNTSVPTISATNYKKLKPGWEFGWTFFGKPFKKFDNALSGLSFGGKVGYSRWKRDSTWTQVTFLGVRGIVRYYLPRSLKPLGVFAQAGGGWFTGEYGFSDPDTVDWSDPDFDPVVTRGQNCFGFDLGVGVDVDIFEILPIITFVKTENDLSIWLSLNLGMTF